VRMLVEAQGGKMGVETAIDPQGGIGVRLWVMLPIQEPSVPIRQAEGSDLGARLGKKLC